MHGKYVHTPFMAWGPLLNFHDHEIFMFHGFLQWTARIKVCTQTVWSASCLPPQLMYWTVAWPLCWWILDKILLCQFLTKWHVPLSPVYWVTKMTTQAFSFQEPRAQRRQGGLGLFVSSANKFRAISLPTQTSLESISGKLECSQSSCLTIPNIYSPPGPTTTFFSDLQDILVLHILNTS